MAELVRGQVFLDQAIGSEEVQIMLEGDIIVPDIKPDMALLLQTDERVVIDRTEAGNDRVNYVGQLNITILYVAKDAGKRVESIDLTRGIDDFINFDGVTKEMRVRTKAEIVNIDYRVVNDRKVNYRAVVNLVASAEHSNGFDMVTHIDGVPENQILKTNLNINRTIEHRVDRFQVRDQLVLPASKPNFNEVLQTTVGITNRDVRIADGRVNLAGQLQLTAVYRGDSDESHLELFETELPFSGPMDVTGAKDNMFADVHLQVLDQHVTIRPDDDGEDRILDIEISVGVELKVYSTETISILEDAYSINQQLLFAKTTVQYPQLVCVNNNQASVKEVVALGDGTPDMFQIFRVKGQVHIDEARIIDDKVIVEGAINTDILYVAESDATPLASHRTVIPYRQVVEAKGATPGMNVTVDAVVDHAAFNMLSKRETEVRFQLSFATQVVRQKQTDIIGDVEIVDIELETLASQPSMTVYIVQPGDSLWRIAKRFNAPLDDLVAVNELDDDRVFTGQKLLMLKKG